MWVSHYLKVTICDLLISLSMQFNNTKYEWVILLSIEVLLSYYKKYFNIVVLLIASQSHRKVINQVLLPKSLDGDRLQ